MSFADGDSLLVAAPDAWREACLAVPAMRALKRAGVSLTVLCPERQAGFWLASGFGDLIPYPEKVSVRRLAALLGRFESSLVWEAGRAADACAKAKIARRFGPDLKDVAKRLTVPIDVATRPGPIEHRVRFYLGIAGHLGAETMVAENFTPLVLSIPRAMDRVLLVPDSDFGAHFEWPLERWVALAKELLERGRSLWIATSGPRGEALAAAVPEAHAEAWTLPGLDDLASCALCIAADGSVPHLAAHVGTTCMVLFGPGEPEWMRPLGRHHAIVRRKVECSPCHAAKCRMDLRCQLELEVADVLCAFERLSAG